MDFIEVLCNRCQSIRFSVQDPGMKLKEDDLYFSCSKCLHKYLNTPNPKHEYYMKTGIVLDENGVEIYRD